MATMGRKLVPMESPRSPLERFAWLVRAIRSFSADPLIRSTRSFSSMMGSAGGEQLLPETVNKLENGKLSFTVERCLAYETILGLQPCALVDSYIWLCRESGSSPRFSTSANEICASDMDLIVRAVQEVPLDPLEWIRLARLYLHRRDLFAAPRVRDALFHGLLRDYGNSYERAQRLMREALITVGADIVEHLAGYLDDAPMQYFNAIEIFGYIPHRIADNALSLMHTMMDDRFVAPSVLEAVARNRTLLEEGRTEDDRRYSNIEQFALDLLVDPNELYLPREAALTLLRHSRPVRVTKGKQHQLSQVRDDLRQLSVAPVVNGKLEYVRVATEVFQGEFKDACRDQGLPVHVPGLRDVLRVGIFDEDRLSRLGAGSLLAAWQHADLVVDGLSAVMRQIPNEDYGVQRSIVRLVTKIGGPNSIRQLQKLGSTAVPDQGTRLSIAWALGLSTGTDDHASDRVLRHLWKIATSRSEKRVIVAAARRRGDRDLLTDMQGTEDRVVRAEVLKALRASP